MDNFKNKIIGVWGYGKVGKSLVTFFIKQGNVVYVLDKNETVKRELKNDFPSVIFFLEPQKVDFSFSFFVNVNFIFASPGVNIIFYYQKFKEKFKTEVDLFFAQWQKPIIAVTGSVGKTTVVSFLSSLLHSYNISIATGGNIGTPLLDLLETPASHAVIELSSFQLEYCTSFNPFLVIWTNFYPNHLDRHRTEEDYFKAKYQMFSFQTTKETAIVPTSIIPYFEKYGWPKSKLFFVQDEKLYSQSVKNRYPLFAWENDCCYYVDQYTTKMLLQLSSLPPITVTQNWLTLTAVLYVMNVLDDNFVKYTHQIQPIPHRTEFVATINNITFINDSKSTTIASTFAAIEKYKHRSIILIVGGLSKGVDRRSLFTKMPKQVIYVITFGAEAIDLYTICQQHNIASFACKTVKEAIEKTFSIASQDNIVLFSPAGSSYDLFKNYEERGNAFKNLLLDYHQKSSNFMSR
ncbi:MAG TPA: UDP-N-acetylmuramoyl-L-alanine--D-glutamate ligase [Patescibacteria group bacterium]|nr:UDP-N-acetylmuramoyl-L-alanine--D-glutamate ligase [Patescibacteria group bacterium]